MPTYNLNQKLHGTFEVLVPNILDPENVFPLWPQGKAERKVVCGGADGLPVGWTAEMDVYEAQVKNAIWYGCDQSTGNITIGSFSTTQLDNFSNNAYELAVYNIGGAYNRDTFYTFGIYGGHLNPGVNFGTFVINSFGVVNINYTEEDSVKPYSDYAHTDMLPCWDFSDTEPFVAFNLFERIEIVDLRNGEVVATVDTAAIPSGWGFPLFASSAGDCIYEAEGQIYLSGFSGPDNEPLTFAGGDFWIDLYGAGIFCNGEYFFIRAQDLTTSENGLIRFQLGPTSDWTFDFIALEVDLMGPGGPNGVLLAG